MPIIFSCSSIFFFFVCLERKGNNRELLVCVYVFVPFLCEELFFQIVLVRSVKRS